MNNDTIPSWHGLPLKYVSLVTLTVQNSALILIMHYSRVMPTSSGTRYAASTAVLMNEVIKMAICFVLNAREQKTLLGSTFTIKKALLATFTEDAWKLMIPAGLYTVWCHVVSLICSH